MKKSLDEIYRMVKSRKSFLQLNSTISGAFYLQNIYHSNDDTTELDNVLKLIDSYARTIMIEYQEYRRYCFRDDTLQLEQIHLIYQSSIFQGYSLQYKFHDGEQYEVFIKLNTLGAIHSNQIKRFEVNLRKKKKNEFNLIKKISFCLGWFRFR
jgi:Iap family predicted aminopeptidase